MLKKNIYYFLTILATTFFLYSCSEDTDIPDVSDINIKLNINRFEKDLFALDTTQIESSLTNLKNKYPAFADLYFKRIVQLDLPIKESPFPENISGFLHFPNVRTLYDTTMLVFPDLDAVSKDLTEAFQFHNYYFPERDTPDIFTFISEYTYQTFIFDNQGKDAIGVGLDMFLGENYPYRRYVPDNPSFSAYLTRAFNQQHLTKKVMETVVDDIVGLPAGSKLLDEMVNNGKKMYILDLLLPTTPDTIKWEYTPAQLDWCRQNELQLWTYIIDEELLYSGNSKKFRKLIAPSPSGPSNIPSQAPGRTGNWLGYKIIKNYMVRQPNTTLHELIAQKDAQLILDKSRYRPR